MTIKEVYCWASIVSQLRSIVNNIRREIRSQPLKLLEELLPHIISFSNSVYQEGKSSEKLKEALLVISNTQDYILMGDILESVVIPIMEEWIQAEISIQELLDDRYLLESTSSGFLTIKDCISDRYLHSNNDPMDEARIIIEESYDYEKERYIVWGCGLGYHIYQLYKHSKGIIPIIVYEPNRKMIDYAMEYGVLSWIKDDVMEIRSSMDISAFSDNETSKDGKFFLYPYFYSIENLEYRNKLMEIYIQHRAGWEVRHDLLLNFWRNTELELPDIGKMNIKDKKNDWVVIGGGPSVDESIELIRRWKEEKNIIAVGTIWKRLVNESIIPDYVVLMDPGKTVYFQVEGCEDKGTKLLVNLSAYWRCARDYKGEIYTLCVDTPGCPAQRYANKMNIKLWESGGTVTALAIDIAIHFGAERVYLIGVDLAYPGEISHAKGTNLYSKVDTSNLFKIQSVNGKTVYTDTAFNLYREWIEYRIAQHPEIVFCNVSKTGALIKGTETL